MKKAIAFIIIFFSFTYSFAQTGSLEVSMYCWNDTNLISANVFLYQGDSLIANKELNEEESSYEFDSLEAGKYNLFTYVEGRIYSKHFDLQIIEESTLYFTICESQSYYGVTTYNFQDNHKSYFIPTFGYQSRLPMDIVATAKSAVSFGFQIDNTFMINKHFGIGIDLGTHLKWANLGSYNIFTSAQYQRYFIWNYNAELNWRTFLFDNIKEGNHGFFIDLGVGYNFPIIFRKTIVYNKYDKMINRGFHNYTDFYASMRIGYKFYFLKAEYRLSDYLKPTYQQMPKLAFGIGLVGQLD